MMCEAAPKHDIINITIAKIHLENFFSPYTLNEHKTPNNSIIVFYGDDLSVIYNSDTLIYGGIIRPSIV